MSIKDMVNDIASGNLANAGKAFQDEMMEKIQDAINIERVRVAANLLQPAEEVYEESVEIDEEVEDLDESLADMDKQSLGKLAGKHYNHKAYSGWVGSEADKTTHERSKHNKMAKSIERHVAKKYGKDTAKHMNDYNNEKFGQDNYSVASGGDLKKHPFHKAMTKHGGHDEYKKHVDHYDSKEHEKDSSVGGGKFDKKDGRKNRSMEGGYYD
jgi:hypothetical protein